MSESRNAGSGEGVRSSLNLATNLRSFLTPLPGYAGPDFGLAHAPAGESAIFSISHSCTGSAMLAKTQYECCDLGFSPVGELTHGKTRRGQRWIMPSGCTHPFYQPFGGDIRPVRDFLKTRNSGTGNSRRCLAGRYIMARKTLARRKVPSGADCRRVLLSESGHHRANGDDCRDCHPDIHVSSTESLF